MAEEILRNDYDLNVQKVYNPRAPIDPTDIVRLQDLTGYAAPIGATYITQTPSGVLTSEQAMSLSATGVVMNTTTTGVLTTVAFSEGAIPFGTAGGGHLTQDAANLFWHNGNNRLGINQAAPTRALEVCDPASSFQMRIGQSHTAAVSYDVGRNLGTGMLHWYGNQTLFNGYVFEGVDRVFFAAANNGDFSVVNLGGGSSAIVKASTTGILQRATAGSDYTGIITLTAGAGLTGGGTTAANRTFDVVPGDATIIVNADELHVGAINTANINNSQVTYAKIQNVTADRLLGRGAGGGAGVAQEISLGTHLSFSTTVLNVGGFTPGSVVFAASDGRLTEDNPGFTFDAPNNTLEIIQAGSGSTIQGLRLGAGTAGSSYTIGRHAGNGWLEFYGGQTAATAYRFGGIDGDWLTLSTVGVATISNLGGTGSQVIKASSTGLLSRATPGVDFVFPGGFTSGSVIFANTSGAIAEDNAAFFWDQTNKRLEIRQTGAGAALRLGPATVQYDIGRNPGSGPLEFYGFQAGFIGYRFGGADGDRLVISTTGTVTIANLGGASATLVKTSTAGLLSRATANTDFLVPTGWTAGSVFFANASGVFAEDNAAFFWDTSNKRLEIRQTGAGMALRLGPTGGFAYDIGRNPGTGPLEFYGAQSGATGYRFGGVDGDRMVISTTGTVTIANLGGGSAALTMSSTAGLLQRVTLGTNLSFAGTTLNAATGVPTSRTVTAGAGLTGGGALSADITLDVATADGTITVNANSIQVGTIQTANIANDAVTFAKIQNISSSKLLGRDSSGGDVQEITLGTGLSLSATTLNGTVYAPDGAQYLTLALNGALSAERVLLMSTGFTTNDGGANGNYTVTNDVITGISGTATWTGSTTSGATTIIRATTSANGTLLMRATAMTIENAQTTSTVPTLTLDNTSASGQKVIHFKAATVLHGGFRNDTSSNMISFTASGSHLWTTGGDFGSGGTQRLGISSSQITGDTELVRYNVAGVSRATDGFWSYFTVGSSATTVLTAASQSNGIATVYIESLSYSTSSGTTGDWLASLFFAGPPTFTGGGAISNLYTIYVDGGLCRFDGDGSGYVWEVPSRTTPVLDPDHTHLIKCYVTGVGAKYIKLYEDAS